jgi:hypothetical protein
VAGLRDSDASIGLIFQRTTKLFPMDRETCPDNGEVYQLGKLTIPHFAWMVDSDCARSLASRQSVGSFLLGLIPARVLSNIRPLGVTSGNGQSLTPFPAILSCVEKGKTKRIYFTLVGGNLASS